MELNKEKRILIVEDDFFIRDVYEAEALSLNYTVLTAEDGEKGLQMLRTQKPDIVLLDLMLPKVDGLTILKTAKNDPSLAHIPFIVLTNMENNQIEREIRTIGVIDYLLKIRQTPESVMNLVTHHLSGNP